MVDRSKMFTDFNFKLVVINSLLDKNPSFINELGQYKGKEEIISFLENILLTDEDMDKVDSITFGNNLSIYSYIPVEIDREVNSMDDIALLYNLKSICYE